MKRVLYAGGVLITDDAVAAALSEYAAELARAESADAIDVPGIGVDGRHQVFRLVVGPASQVFIEDADPTTGVDSAAFLADLAERRAALGTPEPPVQGPMEFYDPL